jgi:hypothetical protein
VLRMQETVTRYGDAMQRSHGGPVQIRVGLNAGAVSDCQVCFVSDR